MIRIKITDEVESIGDLIQLLEEIKRMLALGYTCGYYPCWEITGEESTSTTPIEEIN